LKSFNLTIKEFGQCATSEAKQKLTADKMQVVIIMQFTFNIF